MEKCIKKLIIAAVLMGSLVPVSPVYAMDGRGDDQKEEAKERKSAPKKLRHDKMARMMQKLVAIPSREERENAIDKAIALYGSVDARDDWGYTPLMHAIDTNDTELVALLLARKADVNVEGWWGETPLLVAGRTPSLVASRTPLEVISCDFKNSHDKADIVSMLLDRGADSNVAKLGDGATALIRASGTGHICVVRILLNRGADIYAQDRWGNTALRQAAGRGCEEIAIMLIFAGLNYEDLAEKDVNQCPDPTSEMLELMKKAQEVRDNIDERDWSEKRMLDSGIFAALGFPHEIEHLVIVLCDFHTGDQFLDTFVEQLLAKREQAVLEREERRLAEKTVSTLVPDMVSDEASRVENAQPVAEEDARAVAGNSAALDNMD